MMSTDDNTMIIIGGGVGPMAGIALHRKIVEKTPAPEGDHQHIGVVHISLSRHIPDRTEYLMHRRGPNSGKVMAEFVAKIAASFAHLYSDFLVGVPCNTFHAEAIYGTYLEVLTREEAALHRIRPINMIDATLEYIRSLGIPRKNVGLLSTTGTRRSGVWRTALEKEGFAVFEPPPEEQDHVHEIIYSNAWGIKSIWPPTEEARRRLGHYLAGLEKRGVELIILGCTELPLAAPPDWSGPILVDPVDCLANSLVEARARSRTDRPGDAPGVLGDDPAAVCRTISRK